MFGHRNLMEMLYEYVFVIRKREKFLRFILSIQTIFFLCVCGWMIEVAFGKNGPYDDLPFFSPMCTFFLVALFNSPTHTFVRLSSDYYCYYYSFAFFSQLFIDEKRVSDSMPLCIWISVWTIFIAICEYFGVDRIVQDSLLFRVTGFGSLSLYVLHIPETGCSVFVHLTIATFSTKCLGY